MDLIFIVFADAEVGREISQISSCVGFIVLFTQVRQTLTTSSERPVNTPTIHPLEQDQKTH